MTLYNVAVPVVELVEADSPEEAVAKFRERVTKAGFEFYGGTLPDGANAFESEPLS